MKRTALLGTLVAAGIVLAACGSAQQMPVTSAGPSSSSSQPTSPKRTAAGLARHTNNDSDLDSYRVNAKLMVDEYFSAINEGNFHQAWLAGGKNISGSSDITAFADQINSQDYTYDWTFSHTKRTGHRVQVFGTLKITQPNGSTNSSRRFYTVDISTLPVTIIQGHRQTT
jgi:hypothetical protein